MQFALADRLGKTLTELQEMTVHEYLGWISYLKIVEERRRGTTNKI